MKKNLVYISLGLLATAMTLLTTLWPVSAATQYSIIDLGTINGGSSYATGINDSGQVVGYVEGPRSHQGGLSLSTAFRTAPNTPINPQTDNLGTLGGNSPNFSNAYGINDSGQVVGASDLKDGAENAFRTAPNSPINPQTDNLGTLGGNFPNFSSAYGINDSGQVVGSSNKGGGETHAFRTTTSSQINPATDDLGTLGGNFSSAYDINGLGQVVGYSNKSSGETHAFRTSANSLIDPTTDDLGTLGGNFSRAYGINDAGQVVGYSYTSSGQNPDTHAFLTVSNSPINPQTDDLGTLGGSSSVAYGINNSGQAVGASKTADGTLHAFLYDVNYGLVDLNNFISNGSNSDFSVLTQANAINNLGQIVGVGSTPNGLHAFLATPVN